jgi:GGDEF domain-containing protein
VKRTVDALRGQLRDFDVLGHSQAGEFTILMPDPGFSPGERIMALARAVANDVARDEKLNQPARIALAFGYAVYPAEGASRETLIERARIPRIRMV